MIVSVCGVMIVSVRGVMIVSVCDVMIIYLRYVVSLREFPGEKLILL